MNQNPILDELYAIRERLLADVGGDLQKFLAGVATARPPPAAWRTGVEGS